MWQQGFLNPAAESVHLVEALGVAHSHPARTSSRMLLGPATNHRLTPPRSPAGTTRSWDSIDRLVVGVESTSELVQEARQEGF
jgi:hypothetical protein